MFEEKVRLRGSSRPSGYYCQTEVSVKMSRQLTKRFRWCFGPSHSATKPVERQRLTMQGERGILKTAPADLHNSDPALDECRTSTDEGTSKNSDLFSDLSDAQIELDSLEHTEANFSVLVAECHRLRSEKRRLLHMLLDFDGQMEAVTRECQEILETTNRRFDQALLSIKYTETVVKSLREQLDNKVRCNTDLELERNLLQHQLSRALKELQTSVGVARVKEALLTPTF